MDHRHLFPNLIEAFGIVFALFLLQILLGAIIFDTGYQFEAGDPVYSLLVLILSIGTVLSLIMNYKKLGYAALFNASPSSLTSIVLILSFPLFLAMFGAVIWISDLTSLVIYILPMSEQEVGMFQRVFTGGVASFLLICIVAPLIEEMLFRGIILKGLLHHYPPAFAIILASLAFALYHLNIYQFPVTLIIGSFTGWLYYKTRSLWPAIIAHSFYNSIAYSYYLLAGPDSIYPENGKVDFHTLPVLALGVISSIAGLSILKKILKN